MLEATYSFTGDGGQVWPEPFAQLATALGGRDAAVRYVELGARAASFLALGRVR